MVVCPQDVWARVSLTITQSFSWQFNDGVPNGVSLVGTSRTLNITNVGKKGGDVELQVRRRCKACLLHLHPSFPSSHCCIHPCLSPPAVAPLHDCELCVRHCPELAVCVWACCRGLLFTAGAATAWRSVGPRAVHRVRGGAGGPEGGDGAVQQGIPVLIHRPVFRGPVAGGPARVLSLGRPRRPGAVGVGQVQRWRGVCRCPISAAPTRTGCHCRTSRALPPPLHAAGHCQVLMRSCQRGQRDDAPTFVCPLSAVAPTC